MIYRDMPSLVNQIRGVSYKPEDIRDKLDDSAITLLRANNIVDGSIELSDVVYIDRKRVSEDQILRRGDILICASSGSKHLVGKAAQYNLVGEYTFGAFCKVIRPKNKNITDYEYLAMFFQSPYYRNKISSAAIGININNIRNEHIDALKVAWPEADNRKNIIQQLESIIAVIRDIQRQLSLLDTLIKARFVEMFGSINNNLYNFPVCTLQDVCEQIKDGTHQTPEYTEDIEKGYKFLSSKDVTTGKIDWNHLKYIPESLHKELYARIAPRKGDILLAKNGTTGIAALVDTDDVFDIYVSLALLRPIDVHSVYLWSAINSVETRRQFDSSLKGIGVPNLHLGEIKRTRILIPPKRLQQQFAAFVSQVDKTKAAVQAVLDKAQLMFDSLMEQYFG